MTSALQHWTHAYHWVCARRRHAAASADIWDLRFHWPHSGQALFDLVLAGRYRLSAMRVHRSPGRNWVQWSARDALVLKWLALEVEPLLPVHARCTHVRGHGGGQASVREVWQAVRSAAYPFVLRTDIRGYYRHIRKEQVSDLIRRHVGDPVYIGLIEQYLHYSVEDGGEFHTPRYGICRGCALSPLIGATLLHHVDSDLAGRAGIYYVRYMDDFLLLSSRRWPLRRAISRLQGYFAAGGFSMHPDKTQLGRTAKGFDWLGAWFTPEGLSIAPRALQNHRDRRARLYEQAIARGLGRTEALERVRVHERRWIEAAGRALRTVRLFFDEPIFAPDAAMYVIKKIFRIPAAHLWMGLILAVTASVSGPAAGETVHVYLPGVTQPSNPYGAAEGPTTISLGTVGSCRQPSGIPPGAAGGVKRMCAAAGPGHVLALATVTAALCKPWGIPGMGVIRTAVLSADPATAIWANGESVAIVPPRWTFTELVDASGSDHIGCKGPGWHPEFGVYYYVIVTDGDVLWVWRPDSVDAGVRPIPVESCRVDAADVRLTVEPGQLASGISVAGVTCTTTRRIRVRAEGRTGSNAVQFDIAELKGAVTIDGRDSTVESVYADVNAGERHSLRLEVEVDATKHVPGGSYSGYTILTVEEP